LDFTVLANFRITQRQAHDEHTSAQGSTAPTKHHHPRAQYRGSDFFLLFFRLFFVFELFGQHGERQRDWQRW
jgi:hypothetical protein